MTGKETFEFVPNTFQTPNDYVDKIMYMLTNPELRCLIYAVRRILGFNKRQDCISISQFVSGTKRSDGSYLDHGTGMSRQSVSVALEYLENIGLLVKTTENNPRVNKGAEYALQLDGSKIDYQYLMDRYETWKKDNEGRMTQARIARETTPSTQQTAPDPVYPVDGVNQATPSNQQTAPRLLDRLRPVYPVDTQYTDLNTDLNTDNIGRQSAPEVEQPKNGNGIVKNPGALAALVAFEKHKSDFDYGIYPEEVRDIIREFCNLFNSRPPHKGKKGGEYAQWISSARELMDACGEFGLESLRAAREDYGNMPDDRRRMYMIAWPGAALKLTRAAASRLRSKASADPQSHTFEQFDEMTFYAIDRHATEEEYQDYLRKLGVRV